VAQVTVLTRQAGLDDAEFHGGLGRVAPTRVTGALSGTGARPALLDLPHAHDDARAKFARRGRVPIDGLWWGTDRPPGLDVLAPSLLITVESHVGWPAATATSADPDDVVKQVSFLWATEGVPIEEFRAHYRAHVEVARRHMPALWQYVQNDVVDIAPVDGPAEPGAQGLVAISELWFRTTDDFLHHYFPSPADEAEFRSHEGFLDLTKASSFICSSHSPAEDRRP
jgi:hypothetical protein